LPRAPASFDWRDKAGIVSAIKDQGQCGSCWAFSATENIESVWALAGNKPAVLAPQQIVDCDDTCYGCGGGWPYLAFQYVLKATGQDPESAYPYTARDGTCRLNKGAIVAKLGGSGYKSISKDEAVIQSSLTTVSPFSICVDASSWQFYSSGVMTADQCGSSVDHCVQLIGYDTTGAKQAKSYWTVRNSWGTDWGFQGLILLEMFTDTCIMADYVTTATLN